MVLSKRDLTLNEKVRWKAERFDVLVELYCGCSESCSKSCYCAVFPPPVPSFWKNAKLPFFYVVKYGREDCISIGMKKKKGVKK